MLDPRLFTPLPPDERRALGERYLEFVRERDGEPDLGRRTLARREAWFAELARTPFPPWTGERIDPAAFKRWHLGEQPLRDASPLAVWLVQIARANEGEEWGVDYLLDRGGFQGLGKHGRLQPRDFADLEETYHTRIFKEIVCIFGLDFELRPPPRPIQQSVKLMAYLPEALSFTLLAAGELMGTIAFLELAERADRLLKDHPAVAARIRDLLDEILIDEVGHVTYLLGSMGAARLSVVRATAKAYQRFTRRSYYKGMRDDSVLGYMMRGIENYSLALFPERVLRRSFVPAAYWPAALAAA
jgi:hypothetical protein